MLKYIYYKVCGLVFSENQFKIFINFNKLILVDLTILLHRIVVYRSNSSTFKYNYNWDNSCLSQEKNIL